jgi:hypothetical protein
MWISPSSYKWLIPPIEDKNLDILVSKDLYPVIEGLLPAVGYAILFGVMRVILTSVLFKVGISILQIHHQRLNFILLASSKICYENS